MIRQLKKYLGNGMNDRLEKSQVIGRGSNKKATETTMRKDESLIQGSETKYEKSKRRIYRTQRLNRCEEYRKRGINND